MSPKQHTVIAERLKSEVRIIAVNLNASEWARSIERLQYLMVHYRWAMAEYRNQIANGASAEDLARFREWVAISDVQEFTAICAAILRAGAAGQFELLNPLRATSS